MPSVPCFSQPLGLKSRAMDPQGAGPLQPVAHIQGWLWQPRAPEPGWKEDNSLQCRRWCCLSGQTGVG